MSTADRPTTEPRTEARVAFLRWLSSITKKSSDYLTGVKLLDAAFQEAEAAQGAAPRPLEVEAWVAGYVAGREDGPGRPDDEVAERAVDAVCAIRMDEGAAPRAEGLDVRQVNAHVVIQEWGDALATMVRLSRPSDERVPESEEPR